MQRRNMAMTGALKALALSVLLTSGAVADEAVFTPTDDNFMLSDLVSWSRHNWGTYPQMAVGLNAADQPYRSLMRFDIASLGSSTSITSATIRLTVTRSDKLKQANGNFDLKLFLIDNANTDWVEGTQLEHPATAGDPCWRFRQYDTVNWAGGPGIGNSTASAGIAALLDTVVVDVTNTVVGDVYTFVVDTPEGINALTNWAAGGDNAGLLMTTDEGSVVNAQNAIYFGSKENTTPANRPEMTVHTTTGDVSFGTSDDTIIWKGSFVYYESWNWATDDEVLIGLNAVNWPYRALMRFDLEPLRAAYTKLTSVALTLTVTSVARINAAYGDFELRLFLLDDANAGWVEGNKNALPAGDGESCWEYLSYDDTGWSGGKGIGNSTVSAGISNLLASVTVDVDTVTNGQKIVLSLDSPEALAAVERWISGGTNAGMLLVTDEASAGQNALQVGSSENSDPAKRPEFKLTYTADVSAFPAAEDNFMYNNPSWVNANWGAWSTPRLAFGRNSSAPDYVYRAIMRFDLSSLNTSGKRIKWARLTLTQGNNGKIVPENGAFETRLLLPVTTNADWIEGTKSAATAGTGESCWNRKKYNTVDWTGGAGIGNSTNSAGVAAQVATALIDPVTIAVGDKIIFYLESPESLAVLQRWADGGVNEGFLLATDEIVGKPNALQVYSSEYSTVEDRPMLEVVLERVIPKGTVILVY